MMGSESGANDEKPVHRVRITKDFLLKRTPVTQRQWEAVMGTNPSRFNGNPAHPVDMVNWEDAQEFIAKLNSLVPGGGFRLPTEAEWEYACRAGTTGDYGGTGRLEDMGWHDDNSGDTTRPVAQKQANAWGAYSAEVAHPFQGKWPTHSTVKGSGSGVSSERSDAGVDSGCLGEGCWGGLLFLPAHGGAFEGDAVGVVDEAIEDGVGEGGVADGFMAVLEGELAGDQGGLTAGPVLDDLEEVAPFHLGEGDEAEVVEDQKAGLLETIQETGPGSVGAGEGQVLQEAAHAVVAGGEAVTAGGLGQGTGEEGLPGARRTGDEDDLVLPDPVPGGEAEEDRPVEARQWRTRKAA